VLQGTVTLAVYLTPVGMEEVGSGEQNACLNVTLLSAEDLVAKDVSGLSDPYCRLKIEEQTFKSTTKFNTLSAAYNEHFQFLEIRPDQV
jgi:Ca2+-dependent lipid-binding protein